MPPAVSVVIATYNYGRYLGSALASVQAQTFEDFEVLVVDDGSTDDTAAVVQSYLSDRRVRYLRTDHRGQPRAKNVGIRAARAPLIAFLDADDLWLPTKLQRQIQLLENEPAAGVVHAPRRLIDEAGWELEYDSPDLPRGQVLESLFVNNFVCFSAAVVRRRVFERVGLFDEQLPLAIDYDLWLRAARHFHFDHVAEPLVLYRTGHGNLSRRREERLQLVMQIMQRFLDQHGGRACLSAAAVRRAWADTYSHMAELKAAQGPRAALPWLLRALRRRPLHARAWRGLVWNLMPQPLHYWQRRLRGRPPQQMRRRLPNGATAALLLSGGSR